MPGTDLELDPLTHDFVDDGAGDWVETSTLMPQVHHQILDHRGLWFADAEAGSDAYTLPRKTNAASISRFEAAYRSALQVFVDAGQAEDVEVEMVADGNRANWEGSLVDLQHGVLDVSPLLPYGVG